MLFFFVSALLLLIAYPSLGAGVAIWLLLCSQFTLLVKEIASRQVSGVGGFIFMYFLFFGMRPLYLYLENDIAHFTNFFLIRVNPEIIGAAMWWATLGLLCFTLGAHVAIRTKSRQFQKRAARVNSIHAGRATSMQTCIAVVGVQLCTLPIMMLIARMSRGLYSAGGGAYLYDLPMPMQAVHIFAVVILAGRYWRTRSSDTIVLLVVSVLLLMTFTAYMREVTNFRGFYITGLIVAGLAVLQQFKTRVGYAWLIIPILVAQPFFAYLGAERNRSNDELAEVGIFEGAIAKDGLLGSYWHFYNGGRDMNIFDTFVAAKESQPRFYPYVWSWAYVPLHLIPRAVWPGKPKNGLTQDMKFTRKAPLSPGIAGFFLLDGGLLWMLGCMGVLGYLVALLDTYLLTLPQGYWRSCMIGVVVVNGMFLSRVLLWQYLYQMLYMTVVIALLAWYARKSGATTKTAYGLSRQSRAAFSPSVQPAVLERKWEAFKKTP